MAMQIETNEGPTNTNATWNQPWARLAAARTYIHAYMNARVHRRRRHQPTNRAGSGCVLPSSLCGVPVVVPSRAAVAQSTVQSIHNPHCTLRPAISGPTPTYAMHLRASLPSPSVIYATTTLAISLDRLRRPPPRAVNSFCLAAAPISAAFLPSLPGPFDVDDLLNGSAPCVHYIMLTGGLPGAQRTEHDHHTSSAAAQRSHRSVVRLIEVIQRKKRGPRPSMIDHVILVRF